MADCTESTEESNQTNGPQIIVKFDGPEASENSANDEVEGQSGDDNQTPSAPSPNPAIKIHSPVLTASKFGNSFGISEFSKTSIGFTSSVLKPSSLLRPSQLTPSSTNSSISSPTVQSDSSNPFTKVTDAVEGNGDDSKKSEDPQNNDSKKTEEAPKFLPLGASSKDHHENSVNSSVTGNSSTSGFVFGQNLKERVTVTEEDDKDSVENEEKEEAGEKAEKSHENGASELLFSSAASVSRSTSRPGLTLTQAAQEIEEANRANKRKYSQVTPLTGEEGETNVLQINCKLFAFDKGTSSWQERGRGTLRLNDRDDESRLVGRATGTQRLIINTKVWPGMTAELAGPKSLRLTAMDVHGDIRIFIVQAAPKEVYQLHIFLMQRLKRAKERQPKKLATEH